MVDISERYVSSPHKVKLYDLHAEEHIEMAQSPYFHSSRSRLMVVNFENISSLPIEGDSEAYN